MKKVVHIVESFGGGVFSYLTDLTEGMNEYNYKIYILYGLRKQTPENFQSYFDKNITLIKIPSLQRELNPAKDLKAMFEIKEILKEINPDIIHLHSSKAGGIGRMLRFKKSQKIFYTPHGYSFLDSENNGLKSKVYFAIEKILGKRNICTIACSKSEYLASKKVTRKSTFVNNAVDTQYLKEFYTKESNSKNVIFTIGRISNQKNPRLFNKIANEMKNFEFVWIGDGPLKSELKSSNITVTGWLSRDEVLRMIQPYRYFVLTSKWEGLPISLLEAMYFSKICFVTNVVGNNDVIRDGMNGYLFNNNIEFESKFKTDKQLIEDPRAYVVNGFSKQKMIKKYKNIYDGSF